MKNKYWKLSGWYIFDLLDKQAHGFAVDAIWECVTASAEIKYFSQVEVLDKLTTEIFILNKTKKTVVMRTDIKWVIAAVFTFVKI